MRESQNGGRNVIGIAVSTMNGAVLQNQPLLKQIEELCWPTVIVNQHNREGGQRLTISETQFGPHVIIEDSEARGLCVSRNLALDILDVDWLLLCDDDVALDLQEAKGLKQDLSAWPFAPRATSVGALSARLKKDASTPWREYASNRAAVEGEGFTNGLLIQKMNSMELVVNRRAMQHWNLRFDEQFGLGSALTNGGEEAILLHGILRAGGVILPVDWSPRIHPEDSSGQEVHAKGSFTLGAVHRRVFGPMVWGALLLNFGLKRLMRGGVGPKGLPLVRDYWRGGRWAARHI